MRPAGGDGWRCGRGGRGDVLWKFCCTLPGLDGDLESFQVVCDGDKQLLSDVSPEHLLFGPLSPGPPTWTGPEAGASAEASGRAEEIILEEPPRQKQRCLHTNKRSTAPSGTSWCHVKNQAARTRADRRSSFHYSACVSATLASPVSLAEGTAL